MQGAPTREKRVGQLKGRNEKKVKLVFLPSSPVADRVEKSTKLQDQYTTRSNYRRGTTTNTDSGSSSPTSHSRGSSQELLSMTEMQRNWQKIAESSARDISVPAKAKVTYSNRTKMVQSVSDDETVDQGLSSDDEVEATNKIKNIHSLCEQGLSKRYKDELVYIADGLSQPKINIKRTSMMDLLKKSKDAEFLNACRKYGIMEKFKPEEFNKDLVKLN